MIRRRLPSFFPLEPNGEQCKFGSGADVNGPAVCPLATSFIRASVTAGVCSVADRRFRGRVTVGSAEKPMSNPYDKPLTR